MYRVFDVLKKDDEYHIIIKTENGAIRETMPLRKYIEEGRVIVVGDEMLTIAELIDREFARILKHSRVVDAS